MVYDENNIFAKMLRGEIPVKKIYEDEYALAFPDINPQAPVHVLVIPKFKARNFPEFVQNAANEQIAGFMKAVATVAAQLGLQEDGYRILSNIGKNGGQEVPHLHIHLFAGKVLGPMLCKK